MKFCALGLTIIARIHGSLKRSPTRTTLAAMALDGATESSLRFTATVVSAEAAGAARANVGPVGSVRATAIGTGCAASASAFGIGSLSVRSAIGHGAAAALAI